jgi:hypothetical protein
VPEEKDARAWADGLVATVPEARSLVEKHQQDQDGVVLLHVLMGDVTRFVEDAHADRNLALMQRCLTYLDESLRTGPPSVQNAVSVSFVEAAALWDDEDLSFVRHWPEALREDAARFVEL